MIEPSNQQLSISRQCKILDVSRSSYYYQPKPIKQEDLDLMRKIDELYLENPSSGSRTIRRQLEASRHHCQPKKIQRLMRLMGIEAVYPKPNTSRPHPEHKVYPYLLRDLTINRPNQVWATDITYIPMDQRVHVSWWPSWTGTAARSYPGGYPTPWRPAFCVDALKEALSRYGPPEIFNTDQGAQFTSNAFTKVLIDNKVAISMDGRGRCQDNIFVERLWWTLKHQYIYLHSFDTGKALRQGLAGGFIITIWKRSFGP
jgi:putative transposase